MRSVVAIRTVLSLVGGLACVGLPCAAECEYNVTAIEGPECGVLGPALVVGQAINNNGEVVGGYSVCLGFQRPFYWSEKTGFVAMPLPPGVPEVIPVDINDEGMIVGTMGGLSGPQRGFVYHNGSYTILPPVGGVGESYANAINNDGVAVGGRQVAANLRSAYSWTGGNGIVDLFPQSSFVTAFAINDNGRVVGSIGPILEDEAIIWDGKQVQLLGPIPGGFSSRATDVNEFGVVLGAGWNRGTEGELVLRSFVWDDGTFTLLGALEGYEQTNASAMNRLEVVVGRVQSAEFPYSERGMIWRRGMLQELDSLLDEEGIVFLGRAHDINDHGQIVVEAATTAGSKTLVLTPCNASPTDLDGDCRTDETDLVILLDAWGTIPSAADFNADGNVGFADLTILLVNWG